MFYTQDINLTVINGKPIATSRDIAMHFNKRHKNVLRDIKNLDCSPQFNGLNFEPVDYKDSTGEMRKEYQITRNGFVFLAMGFTGKRAAQFKEAYIQAFDDMEYKLQNIHQAALQQPAPTLDYFLGIGKPLEKTLVEVTHTQQGEIVNVTQLMQPLAAEINSEKSTVSQKPAWIRLLEMFFAEMECGEIPEKMRQNMLLAKENITVLTGKRERHICLFFRAANMMAFLRKTPCFIDLMDESSIHTTQVLLAQLEKADVLAFAGKTKEKGIPINPNTPSKTRRVSHLVAIDLVVLHQKYGVKIPNSKSIANTTY